MHVDWLLNIFLHCKWPQKPRTDSSRVSGATAFRVTVLELLVLLGALARRFRTTACRTPTGGLSRLSGLSQSDVLGVVWPSLDGAHLGSGGEH